LSPYTSGRQTFFIAAQITFSIAIVGPLHLQPLEQNEWTKRIRHRQYATAVQQLGRLFGSRPIFTVCLFSN